MMCLRLVCSAVRKSGAGGREGGLCLVSSLGPPSSSSSASLGMPGQSWLRSTLPAAPPSDLRREKRRERRDSGRSEGELWAAGPGPGDNSFSELRPRRDQEDFVSRSFSRRDLLGRKLSRLSSVLRGEIVSLGVRQAGELIKSLESWTSAKLHCSQPGPSELDLNCSVLKWSKLKNTDFTSNILTVKPRELQPPTSLPHLNPVTTLQFSLQNI